MNIAILEDLGCSTAILDEKIEALRAKGHKVSQFEKTCDLETLKSQMKNADIVILANMPLPVEALESAPKVKFIDVAFTGVDHIPMEDARRRGIVVSNASGYANQAVAELCISFIIQLFRQLDEAQKRARSGGVKTGLSGRQLQGKTVGIIGAGAIGKTLARLCKAFGAKVIAHNRHAVSDPAIDASVSLDELLDQSDVVSINCPLTKETRGLIGREQLARMKNDAILVNAGRGPVVDNKALAEALAAGEIAGAACDVFDMEPPLPPDYPLLKAPNIILTPHLGFYSQEAMDERARIVFDNLDAWLDGAPKNRVC